MGFETVAAFALLARGQTVKGAALDLKHVGRGIGERGQDAGLAAFREAREAVGGQAERTKSGGGAFYGFDDVVQTAEVGLAKEVECEVEVGRGDQAPMEGRVLVG